jgi:hypothetical protein
VDLSAERAGTASSITHLETDCSATASFAGFAATFPFGSRRMIFAADFLEINCRLRDLEVHFFHRGDDDLRNREIAEPFVVCGNHEPGSIVGVAAFKGILVCMEIVIPVLALSVVRFADLLSLGWIVKALFETLELFFLADVKKELQDVGAVLRQTTFEVVDLVVALRPDRLRH